MIKWDRKHVVRLLYVAAGREVAEKYGLELGAKPEDLRFWFSEWRWNPERRDVER
jgi:hypothetical protein